MSCFVTVPILAVLAAGALAAAPPAAPGLAPPGNIAVIDEGEWNYTASGTVADPDPASLTVKITVDGVAKGSVAVKPDGTWTLTFGLPACTSANDATRFGTAAATDGTRASAPAAFIIDQTPVPPSKIGP